jgi:multidrug resistance efflux pump
VLRKKLAGLLAAAMMAVATMSAAPAFAQGASESVTQDVNVTQDQVQICTQIVNSHERPC